MGRKQPEGNNSPLRRFRQSNDQYNNGFMQSHAFTILNVARENGAVSVTVRDPRYYGENRPDGTITIPLPALMKNFRYLFVESAGS